MGKTIRFNENGLIAIKKKLNEIMVGTSCVSHNDVCGNQSVTFNKRSTTIPINNDIISILAKYRPNRFTSWAVIDRDNLQMIPQYFEKKSKAIEYKRWHKSKGDIIVNLDNIIGENVGKEFAPVATIGDGGNNPPLGGNHYGIEEESIDFNDNGMSINDEKILGKYNLKDLILSKTGNYVTLNKIVAKELGKGYGTKFMEELARVADENGWILVLTPDTTFGGSSVSRLKNFYKRFGFVPNKGKNTDFNTRESMIRKPINESNENTFEKWFGNSILRDENGNPIKMYHGTDVSFNSFGKEHIGKHGSYEGYGFNFTPYYTRAVSYNSNNVIEAYLRAEHPMTSKTHKLTPAKIAKVIAEIDKGVPYTDTIVAAFETPRYRENWDAMYYRRALPVAARYIYNTSRDDETGDAGTYASICLCGNGDVYKVISAFEKLGYDSVIHYSNNGNINTVIVFEANQIKLVGNKTYNNDSELMGENIDQEVSSSDVDLSSFKKRDTLPPGIWKDEETLDSRVRLKLLDIADDFWEFINLSWVEPKGIIITGSICNFNWSKFSDIDLHIIADFKEIDEKTEFVKQYVDSKKNEWNTEHEGLKIMGFPVELYVQNIDDDLEAGGIYDLEENAWIRKPNPHSIKSIGLNKFSIKDKAAEIMTIIDDMYDKLSSTSDSHEIDQIGDDAHYLWDKVKELRKKSLSKNGESGSGNIVYKVLRRTGYLDKLFKLFSTVYDRSNSINESLVIEGIDLFGIAKNYFGTTNDFRECGFILPDGSMLDLSGRHTGAKEEDVAGRRRIEHRSIEYMTDDDTIISLSRFLEAGAIRCDLRGKFINLIKAPNEEQISVLSRFITRCGGCVQLDIGDDDISIDYVEYDGVNYRRIINDILNFFDNKIKPSSLYESIRKYLTVLEKEVAMDGSSEGNPYEKRWKTERDALKNFVANYGKLMQSKEDDKGGKLYKVYFDETMSNLIGYNYCICVQWNEQEMKPGSTVYIRALDKFTPFIRRNLQFDTRGRDNMRGTYDDTGY